jgi:hypothetical protein
LYIGFAGVGGVREEQGEPQRQASQGFGVRFRFATGFSLLEFLTRDDDFSRTVAEAWIVLQVAYRYNLGVNVDYKTAQREGEQKRNNIYDLFPYSRERVV